MNFNVINIEETNNNKQNEMNKKDIKLKKNILGYMINIC